MSRAERSRWIFPSLDRFLQRTFCETPFCERKGRWQHLNKLDRGVSVAKVLTLPIKPEMPDPARRKAKPRKPDPRYVEGQRLLVEAMKYLIQQDPQRNKDAVSLISEHFRTRFRMSDRPVDLPSFSPESR